MFDQISKLVPIDGLLSPASPFFWFYLVVAAVFALAVCLLESREEGAEAFGKAARRVFDPKVFFHRSAIVDYLYIYLNSLIFAFVVGMLFVSSGAVSGYGVSALTHLFGPSPAWRPTLLAGVAYTLALALAYDFANFYFHLLQHRLPALWELHKVHHSAEVLTPITAMRIHPVAGLLGTQFIALFTGSCSAVFLYLFNGSNAEFTILGVNAVIFCWHTLLANHLAHTHIWVMFPKGMREVFYSPALHLMHHTPQRAGNNLGFVFSFWDRLWGTLYEPTEEDRRTLVLGLEAEDMAELQTTFQLYWTPVRNILFGRKPLPDAASPIAPAE